MSILNITIKKYKGISVYVQIRNIFKKAKSQTQITLFSFVIFTKGYLTLTLNLFLQIGASERTFSLKYFIRINMSLIYQIEKKKKKIFLQYL